MEKTKNKTGRDHCGACDDTGWVELRGTVKVGATTYSRGMTACRWCEWGQTHFDRDQRLESNYGAADIELDPAPGRPFKPDTAFLRQRVQAGCSIPSLQAIFPASIWPPEWPSPVTKPDPLRDHEAAEIAHKREIAARELETTPQEPVSAIGDKAHDSQHAENEPEIELEDVPF